VGESGCGKSLTALALMRLLPQPAATIRGGRVLLAGEDLLSLPARAMRAVRGRRIAMVFQEPMTSLNPVFSCGEQIAEVLRTHRGMDRRSAWRRTVELLEEVGIDRPADRARQVPHEFSGGMRQRVMIAMAISAEPEVLVADEPTTALDVTVQAQILDLLDTLRQRHRMALVLVTHDLALVAQRAENVAVMYAGRIVEAGPVETVFRTPRHPYTLGLLACRPVLGRHRERLPSIGGQVPELFDRPSGCAFHPRCPFAVDACRQAAPALESIARSQFVACTEHERTVAAGRWPDV
jgi:peptide/nickel transport system ATP-binding protein